MPSPIRQLLSQTSYDADGTTTVWDFSFASGYIDKSHVKAFYLDINGARTDVTVTLGMFIGDFQLSITPALAVGNELTIYRDTPKDAPLVNFADKAVVTEAALDLMATQAVFVAAEASDGLATAISSVAQIAAQVTLAAGYAQDAADEAAAAAASASAANASALSAAASAAAALADKLAAAASAAAAAASAASIAGGPVASFNTRTGAVTLLKADVTGVGLAKADVGLGNVDNTSDLDKPVSTATAAAIPLAADIAPVANTAAVIGVSARYARQDHSHAAPATGSITEPMLATAVQPLGVGQTWQLVTRTTDVTYTNTTGRPIYGVRANLAGSPAVQTMAVAINGGPNMFIAAGNWSATSNRVDVAGSYVIPAGATYVFADGGVGTITTYELR